MSIHFLWNQTSQLSQATAGVFHVQALEQIPQGYFGGLPGPGLSSMFPESNKMRPRK